VRPGGRRIHLDPPPDDQLVEAALTHPRPSAVEAEERSAAAREALAALPSAAAPVLEQLGSANVAGMGQLPYATNAVFLLELAASDPVDRGQPLRAIYKPMRGERPLWDFPHGTLHLREAAAWAVDAALGLGLVPPTTLREGPHGWGSVQLFIRPPRGGALTGDDVEERLWTLGAFDALVNNADRKRAHLLVDRRGGLWGIDHGLCFLPYPRQRTVLIDMGGEDIVEQAIVPMAGLNEPGDARTALHRTLSLLLDSDEVRAFWARLAELVDDPVYPELDPWDGRPFEW
jgi:hypothetical protein